MGGKEREARIKESFLREFNELLKKYGASLEAEDHWEGYAECGEDIRITVSLEPPGEHLFVSLDLGNFVAGGSHEG